MDKVNEAMAKEGWLQKRGEVNKGWKNRWFEVRDGMFFYYKHPGDAKALGAISLDPETVSFLRYDTDAISFSNPRNESIFRIRTPKRVYILQAEGEKEMNEWVVHLTNVQHVLKGDENWKPSPTIYSPATSPRTSATLNSSEPSSPYLQSITNDLQMKIQEQEKKIQSLERHREEDNEVIKSLRTEVDRCQAEAASYARLMSCLNEPTNDIKEELKKTKTNLLAQLSQTSYLTSENTRLQKELADVYREKEKQIDSQQLDEMKSRYNYIERKLAVLCSKVKKNIIFLVEYYSYFYVILKYNEQIDDPITIDMINSIDAIETEKTTITERYLY